MGITFHTITPLRWSGCEMDLKASSDLRPRTRCIQVWNRVNRVLCFISRSVRNRKPEVILIFFFFLGFCVEEEQIWQASCGADTIVTFQKGLNDFMDSEVRLG